MLLDSNFKQTMSVVLTTEGNQNDKIVIDNSKIRKIR